MSENQKINNTTKLRLNWNRAVLVLTILLANSEAPLADILKILKRSQAIDALWEEKAMDNLEHNET